MAWKNYLKEAEAFVRQWQPRHQSVITPFIPAIQLMRSKGMTYKGILEFINLQGTKVSYSALVAFFNTYMGRDKRSGSQRRPAQTV